MSSALAPTAAECRQRLGRLQPPALALGLTAEELARRRRAEVTHAEPSPSIRTPKPQSVTAQRTSG